MASLVNSACLLFLPVALLLMLSPCPVAAASHRRCHSIYKGFAQCLMALGDSLTDSAHKDEDPHEIHSICRPSPKQKRRSRPPHTRTLGLMGEILPQFSLAKHPDHGPQDPPHGPPTPESSEAWSWDEFHDCANLAMAGCPEEAAAVWESLRQESKKMQFSGNLYDMCSNRKSHSVASSSPHGSQKKEEVNQESLRGRADHLAGDPHTLVSLSPLLLLLLWI